MTKRKKTTPTFGEQIAQQILENYDIKDAQDIQDALKQVFGPIFEAVLKGEMQNHLGYEKNGHSEDSTNARNGYSQKTLKTSLGEVPIRVHADEYRNEYHTLYFHQMQMAEAMVHPLC